MRPLGEVFGMKLAFIVALLLATSPGAAQVPTNQQQQPLGAGGQGTQSQLCVDDPTYCSTPGGTGFGRQFVVGSEQLVEWCRVRRQRDGHSSPRLDMRRWLPHGIGWVLLTVGDHMSPLGIL
jgi:hypothetical protein